MLWTKTFNTDLEENKNFMKSKIKFCEGKVTANFYDDKVSKEGFHCDFNLVYQIYLQECKYKIKVRNINTFTNDDIQTSTHDHDNSTNKYSEQFIFIGFLTGHSDILQFFDC